MIIDRIIMLVVKYIEIRLEENTYNQLPRPLSFMLLLSLIFWGLFLFFVLIPLIVVSFYPKAANMSYLKKLVYLNATREWLMQMNMRQQNQGRFLSEKEIKDKLSPDHKGLVVNGMDFRLEPKVSTQLSKKRDNG